METDCCALQAGWLDTLLEPMLLNPGFLLSGSRPRAACYSAAEHGGTGCRVRLPAGAREHINGNALYRVGPGMQALVRDAMALSTTEFPYDLAMFLVRNENQSHVHDHPRVYSMAGVVDGALWEEPAYYGFDKGVAFVHAPRRLRMDGLHAVASRADKARLTTAVVVVPGGGGVARLLPRARPRLGLPPVARPLSSLVLPLAPERTPQASSPSTCPASEPATPPCRRRLSTTAWSTSPQLGLPLWRPPAWRPSGSCWPMGRR